MRDTVNVTGMVLKASPVGEYDRRLVILTRERGRITAFCRGCRRPSSSLMAASRPFAFGHMDLYEGRDAYNLQSAEILSYFEELSEDMEGACYGSYFLEFADYYTRENVDETEMLKLLYQSLRALSRPSLEHELVRRVFELKAMVINGEYFPEPPMAVSDSAAYAWAFVLSSPPESLYTFRLKPEVLDEFARCVEKNKDHYIDRRFHSLEILKALL